MTKFLYTVTELIEAGSFTKEEFQNAYNETTEAKTKPWKVFEYIAQRKDVKASFLFEKADNYYKEKEI